MHKVTRCFSGLCDVACVHELETNDPSAVYELMDYLIEPKGDAAILTIEVSVVSTHMHAHTHMHTQLHVHVHIHI